MEFAMYEGPWMVLDHYLIVKPWEPDFDPMNDDTEMVLVWVRIPCIPVEYYDIILFRKLGNRIGRIVRVDQATSLVSRGKFARICVEIDMRKPLISKFTYKEKVRHMAYEGIHLVCFSCGFYEYAKEACPLLRKSVAEQGDNVEEDKANQNEGEVSSTAIQTHNATKEARDPMIPFGVWMIAPKRGGRPPMKATDRNLQLANGRGEGIRNKNGAVAQVSREAKGGSKGRASTNDWGGGQNSNEKESDADNGGDRNRRPNVIAKKKQVVNEPTVEQGAKSGTGAPMPRVRRENGGSSRRAAEEDEHVVVRGAWGGLVIRSSWVYVGDTGSTLPSPVWQPTKEHHGDPREHVDDEGDVVMDLNETPL
ncbi:PREDICTED: uncharacterized protein LOC109146859 [Ipomoea nil]|uniref:uncharacterized protein LOC109146859 n=1 Tax=Ipomoea nil TaxID=35883 RepID=UPI000900ADC4|nr:PREDICTED: uncharacterized protein LOC109146859 [Ipomoea nil]